jgi:hypothetical protein
MDLILDCVALDSEYLRFEIYVYQITLCVSLGPSTLLV